jgi:hypothetical protein
MRSGVTIVWIEASGFSSSWSKNIEQTIVDITVRLIHFTHLSKCIKYLKQARSYERVIIVSIVNDGSNVKKETSIATTDLYRLRNYQQIHSILIVSHTFTTHGSSPTKILTDDEKDLSQILEVFSGYQSMLIRLQQLIDNIQELDNELFTPFNQRIHALRDVRQQLGGFVWSCSFKS